MKRIIMLLAAAVIAVANAQAGEGKFFQLSLTPDIALQSRDTRINGISLGIWSENPQSSFTWGFVNGSTGDSSGLSWGFVNYADSYTGVELGLFNWSKEKFVGLQSGLVNVGKDVHGVQFGTVNYTETLNGLQIGLFSMVNSTKWFQEFPDKLSKVMVFVNWSF